MLVSTRQTEAPTGFSDWLRKTSSYDPIICDWVQGGRAFFKSATMTITALVTSSLSSVLMKIASTTSTAFQDRMNWTTIAENTHCIQSETLGSLWTEDTSLPPSLWNRHGDLCHRTGPTFPLLSDLPPLRFPMTINQNCYPCRKQRSTEIQVAPLASLPSSLDLRGYPGPTARFLETLTSTLYFPHLSVAVPARPGSSQSENSGCYKIPTLVYAAEHYK